MAASSLLFAVLRRTPEGTKRRLRRMLLRGARAMRLIPGSGLAVGAVRRVFPETHDWIHRRYIAYAEQAAIIQFRRVVAPSTLVPPEQFGPDERTEFLRLRTALQGTKGPRRAAF